MNYTEMTDAQICQKVGEIVSRDGLSIIGSTGKALIHKYGEPIGEFGAFCLGWKEFDPCNSWADAGPIILANRITISAPMKYDQPTEWLAYSSSDSDICVYQPNPLRAVMIVFLMMQVRPDAA